MKRTGPTNIRTIELITMLRANRVPAWLRVAKELQRPSRQRRAVNLFAVSKHTRDGEIAVIPGKLLGVGDMEKSITVAAFSFSKQAKVKIKEKKGKAISIKELVEQNPKAEKVRIIG